jgi:hypothetical protein
VRHLGGRRREGRARAVKEESEKSGGKSANVIEDEDRV